MPTDPTLESGAANTSTAAVDVAATATVPQTRKRRRRAPASGAADDCFACRRIGRSCDRRRPYCTQCLNNDITCSGYKTQLTWGVGVASRGKLRGQALPIAKSKKTHSDESAGIKRKSDAITSNTPSSRQTSKQANGPSHSHARASSNSISTPTPTSMTFGFINVDPNMPMESPPPEFQQPQAEWQQPVYHQETANAVPAAIPIPHGPRKSARRHTLQPLQMPPSLQDFRSGPMTANPFISHNDRQYERVIGFSPSTPTYQHYQDPLPAFKGPYTSHVWTDGMVADMSDPAFAVGSWPSDTVSSSLSSGHSSRDFQEEDILYPDASINFMDSETPCTSMPVNPSPIETYPIKREVEDYCESPIESISINGQLELSRHESPHIPASLANSFIGNTRELRELIHYYEEVICPVIVAFDGPTNPYKSHILQLAVGSPGLQHAIAALSASNLRMRRDSEDIVSSASRHFPIEDSSEQSPHDLTVRKSSMAHNRLRGSLDASEFQEQTRGQSKRELFHKGASIHLLEKQLKDASRDNNNLVDDAVLATLLVLCLYHICDTGIAKFKTQFEGVKRIMEFRRMRKCSNRTRWLITMFKWFDAMTATVNDREGQFDGEVGDLGTFETDEWALENLAGCDGRLFTIISRLGRLNLLSQGRDVDGNSPKQKLMAARQPPKDFYSIRTTPTVDQNGWLNGGTVQERYIKEWTGIRQELVDWRFDPNAIPTSMMSLSSTAYENQVNTEDLMNISESFRYSALLYTERLAHPQAPPTASNFQSLVTCAIHHIRAVKSDVYLLWPLFITGSECVDPEHRELVRKRCLDIQKDSGFFNNMSTLSLLTKVWEETPDYPVNGYAPTTTDPFKWRKAMGVVDGEYIVI